MMLFMITTFLLLCTPLVGQEVASLPPVFERTNWGVVFTKVNTILAGHTNYRHTFFSTLPAMSYPPLELMPCETEMDKTLGMCEEFNAGLKKTNKEIADKFALEERSLQRILADIGDIADASVVPESNKKRRRRTTGENGDLEQWHHFNPPFCRPDYPVHDENALGRMVEFFCHSPSNADVDVVRQHICLAAEASDMTKQQILRLGRTLTSACATLASSANSLQRHLDEERRAYSATLDGFKNLAGKTSADLTRVDNLTAYEEKYQQRLILATGQKLVYTQTAELHLTNAREYLGSVNTLFREQKLPPSIVSIKDVRRVLRHVADTLSREHGNRHKLVYENPGFYFETSRPHVARTKNTLIISVDFPLRSREAGGLMDLFRVDTTHVPIYPTRGGEPHTGSTRIKTGEFYALSPNLQYGMCLSEKDVISCWPGGIQLGGPAVCKDQGLEPLNTTNPNIATSCESAIFKDDKLAVKKACRVGYAPPHKTAHIKSNWFKLEDGRYLIQNTPDFPTMTEVCVGKPPKTKPSCSMCIVKLRCGCSLSNAAFRIPPTLCEDDRYDTDESILDPFKDNLEAVVSYPINLYAAISVFTADTVADIRATTSEDRYTYRAPVDLSGLDKKLTFVNHTFQGDVDTEEPFDLDFEVVMEMAIKEEKCFSDETSAIFDHATDFTDLNAEHARALVDSVKNGSPLDNNIKSVYNAGIPLSVTVVIYFLSSVYICCCHGRRIQIIKLNATKM